MKKIVFIAAALLCTALKAFAQENRINIAADMTEVKIHLTNAEVFHAKKIQVPTGTHTLVFTGLSPKLNSQSIIAEIEGDVQILSITSKVNFIKEQTMSAEINRYQDSIKLVAKQIQDIDDQVDAYTRERDMMLQNQSIKGNDNGLTTVELTKMADMFRGRLTEINRALSKFMQQRTDAAIRQSSLASQLSELNSRQQPTSEVYVEVKSRKDVSADASLRYVVSDAGWSPIYDLRCADINKPLNLNYRALAYNNTGIDWVNVKLSLSTSDPLQTAEKPVLSPWRMDYATANYAYYDGKATGEINGLYDQRDIGNMQVTIDAEKLEQRALNYYNPNAPVNKPISEALGGIPGVNGGGGGISFETIDVSELSTDFDIKERYTIPSDRKPYSIDVTEYDLVANYKHYAVPRLDRDPFLLAQIAGWQDLSLISGPVQVYNSGKYVGKSYIETRNLSDTLDLSLGRDQRVLVTRALKKEMNSRQVIGNNRKVTMTFELNVKNNHTDAIDIDLLDQVPISSQKDIVVTVEQTSKAEYNAQTGELKWALHLNPGEKKTVLMSYTIKYPKNRKVEVEQHRKMYAPRF